MKTGKMNSTLPSHKSCVIDKILKKKGYRISKFSVEASKKCNKKIAEELGGTDGLIAYDTTLHNMNEDELDNLLMEA